MRGFLLGLVVAGVVFAAYLTWRKPAMVVVPVAHAPADAGAVAKKRPRRRGRGAMRVARGPAVGDSTPAEPEPEPVRLSAADLRTVGQGDDLSRPDVVRMDLGDGKETHELGQDEIDERFRPEEGAILECISRARPDQETYVPGRVTIKFRIQRTGTVRGVRVDAPAILQKGGLYGCVKGVVGRLRFPASGGSQIVSYPFTLS